MKTEGPPQADPLGLQISVDDHVLGAFGMVASATLSQIFTGAAAIADLWATLPDFPLDRAIVPRATPRYRVLQAQTRIGPPASLASILRPTEGIFPFVRDDELDDTLADYPTTRGFERTGAIIMRSVVNRSEPVLRFPSASGEPRLLSEIGDPREEESLGRMYMVRPRIGTGSEAPPSQLLTLWALLFGLSQLARYHPDAWVRALNPDRAETAVPLENGLDVALARVPELLLPALTGTPLLLRELRDIGGVAAAPEGQTAPPGQAENGEQT